MVTDYIASSAQRSTSPRDIIACTPEPSLPQDNASTSPTSAASTSEALISDSSTDRCTSAPPCVVRNHPLVALDTDDLEHMMHSIGYKKKLDKQDLNFLSTVSKQKGDNIVMSLLILAAQQQMGEKEDPQLTDALTKLSLSRVVNLVDSEMLEVYQGHFGASEWELIEKERYSITATDLTSSLEEDSAKIIDTTLNLRTNIDAMLDFIDEKRYELSKEKKRDCQAYVVLGILEQM
ncbi:hypothetical protein DM01DRAFT_1374024 [Hesseltinella vesiculosa]|uniref:Uncharacterized protein n=1 Tax=Hesseltinella vesiculosa TaxID=101127 RepID=A0A1X2GIM5_9FUNG|nr:hypothetical protein DM01DRAFT_1374024 [Hesseltinella vesiculosa]